MKNMQEPTISRLAWPLRDAAVSVGVSVPYLRKIIASGELRPTKAGRKVLIMDTELRRWLSEKAA